MSPNLCHEQRRRPRHSCSGRRCAAQFSFCILMIDLHSQLPLAKPLLRRAIAVSPCRTVAYAPAALSAQTEERKDVRLYYGTFDSDATAYLDQEKEWSEQNVKVINVYSSDKEYYVQDAFSKVTADRMHRRWLLSCTRSTALDSSLCDMATLIEYIMPACVTSSMT